jgi:hypothetical protein
MRQHPQLLRAWRKEPHFFDSGSEFLAKANDVASDQFWVVNVATGRTFPLHRG